MTKIGLAPLGGTRCRASASTDSAGLAVSSPSLNAASANDLTSATAPSIPVTIAEGSATLKIGDRSTDFSYSLEKSSSSSPLRLALSFVNENVVEPAERFFAGLSTAASLLMRREVLALSAAAFGTLATAERANCGLLGLPPTGGDPTPFLNTGGQAVANGQLVAVQVTFNGRTGWASGVPLDPYDVGTDAHVVESSIGQMGTVSILPMSSNYLSPTTSLIPASGISVMPGGYGTPGYSLGSGPDFAIIHTSTPIPGVKGSVTFAAPPVQGQVLMQGDFGTVETTSGPISGLTGHATGGFAPADLFTSGSPTWYESTDFGYPNAPSQNIGASNGASGAGEWTLDGKLAGLIVYADSVDTAPSNTEFQYFNPAEQQYALQNSDMSATPEPGTLGLFVCGLGYFLIRRRRD